MVEEALSTPTLSGEQADLLLMAYTNRAVDEICGMLVKAGIPFLRIGSELSCDPQYQPWLLQNQIGDKPKLSDMQEKLLTAHVVVGTTSMMQSRSYIFALKHFTLAIVDSDSGTQYHRSARQSSGRERHDGRTAVCWQTRHEWLRHRQVYPYRRL